ncbi:N-fatty-acyl-amino acid synthase/hydrolase PM20D1-like [Gordionus sp. m RMFG-2023]|uniref:N-fatty-acyl-amino acid synthase/hydrolase PM20D1-like n=1 Tax=Gordionus sp. m RMFG-2023 TaxID=3053472 RepID=UPI0031FBEDC5
MFEFIITILAGLLSFIFYLLYKTVKIKELIKHENVSKLPLLDLEWDKVFQRFSKAITFKTVSKDIGDVNESEIKALIKYLEQAFPRVHSCPCIKRRVVNELSLLYVCDFKRLKTRNLITDPSKDVGDSKKIKEKPWGIIAHLDVVPVIPEDLDYWKFEPFSGEIDPPNPNDDQADIHTQWENRYIYGRGTLDCKHVVLGVLQALEHFLDESQDLDKLANSGYLGNIAPFYLVFGHDEEVGGINGAKVIAEMLASELESADIEKPLSFILDEGTNVYTDLPILPLANGPRNVACISISEKSTVRFRLSVNMNAHQTHSKCEGHGNEFITDLKNGKFIEQTNSRVYHSSIPPAETALTILARAIRRVTRVRHPIGTKVLSRDNVDVFSFISLTIAPYMKSMWQRVVFSHPDLFRGFVCKWIFARNSMLNSCQRTTSCVTIFQSGIKDNVVPNHAHAVLNQRIHPSQTLEQVAQINANAINDTRVKSHLTCAGPTVPVSSIHSRYFESLATMIKQIFGSETLVLPIIFPASTDSKHFKDLADDLYRFSPVKMLSSDLNRVHGINERISLLNYAQCVTFYYHFIVNKMFADQKIED